MRLQDLDTTCRLLARLVATQRLTPEDSGVEVRELVLEIDGPRFAVSAGQSVGVIAPGDPGFGEVEHLRLYSVADLPEHLASGATRLHLCVRRCDYIDPYNGERYPGLASNYLCDLEVGARVTLTGPYGDLFPVPADPEAMLILVGAGTGIAPFRAFLKRLYQAEPRFGGKVLLFHGGRTGLEMLYRNHIRNDLARYYDMETFTAIEALSLRPHWDAGIDWAGALATRGEALRQWLLMPHTHVYLAGLESIRDELDSALVKLFGSSAAWTSRKAELVAGGRWIELLY